MLFVFGELGWRRTVRFLSLPPTIWVVNAIYALVASNGRLFSRILFRKTPVA